MSASCIYEGTIRHRRLAPRREFSHPLALAYIDLDELSGLIDGRLVARRPGLVRFRRRDYLGDPGVPLDRAVRDVVEERTGARPEGPIRVLTQLRSFGHCFNPVSFYYCFGPDGERVQALVAEVTNTPWGEQHAYVIDGHESDSAVLAGKFDKALHVSPFMGMDHRYDARATTPAEMLSVHISSSRDGVTVFDATLSLRRRALTRASLARISARYPLATVRVLALIYGHALALKLAGAPVHGHPQAGRA
ncbi:MAG TPA: DUF1365 domain-containing protein [Solirubrobacteraceae bacterium]|nr:DUF1365 domain-containing protein [Solirubrobacteraceae bacterium]